MKSFRVLLLIIILAAVLLLPGQHIFQAWAEVRIRAKLLDYYFKMNSFDKLKFEVVQVIGGSEKADWIYPGKILVLPVLDQEVEQLYLFDLATLNVVKYGDEAGVKDISVYQREEEKVELPLELYIKIETDRKVYKKASQVKMTITAQNVGKRSIVLPLPSTQKVDFIVRDSSGNIVWRWSQSRAFLALLQSMIFARREMKKFTEVWNMKDNYGMRVKPGTYYVEGYIATNPQYPAGRTRIVIK